MSGTERPEYPFPSRRELHGNRGAGRKFHPVTPQPAPTPTESPSPPKEPSAPPTETPATVHEAVHSEPTRPAEDTTGLRSRRIEQERSRARKRRLWQKVRAFFVLVTVLALVGGAAYLAITALNDGTVMSTEADDYPGPGSGKVTITIVSGDAGSEIGQKLVDEGVVKTLTAFVRAFEANKAAPSIRPGTYELKKEMSASEAVAALLDEANRTENTITVNSGETVEQVLTRMADVTDFSREEIDAAVADTAALGLPAEAGGKLEGWFAPGAYEFTPKDTPTQVLSSMIQARIAEFEKLNVPVDQRQIVLTKASIVESEMNIPEFYPYVSRVIENRLTHVDGETQGFLQMDSSVLYGVGKSRGLPPTAEDLANDNPYNTYKNKGLPAGPISIPSQEVLDATLNPIDGDWLYFVTVDLDTGETLFAKTLAEQEKNKKLLDEYCAAHKDKC
ncbi:MAG: aminodeoxychorismate lyase [Actinobacteria bacterium]|nr:MAG: aminodeoxychorismate lyase [Actinomycetota bacterium]